MIDHVDPILIEVSHGELIDRVTILRLKAMRLSDPPKRDQVRRQLAALELLWSRRLPRSAELDALANELSRVNLDLWRAEDDLRACERAGDFGSRFVELARSIYKHNDRRADLKGQVNRLLACPIVDEKVYTGERAG